jgi:hypothetical protein
MPFIGKLSAVLSASALVVAALMPLPDLAPRAEAMDDAPTLSVPQTEPAASNASEFGAIAFTADGSFFAVWKITSELEAEEKVRDECASFGRGPCEAFSFRGEVCAAIASATVSKKRRITYSGGGLSPGDAERQALKRCNADRRARGTCQLRTTVCGDGRVESAEHDAGKD